jgi:hypothetical protein
MEEALAQSNDPFASKLELVDDDGSVPEVLAQIVDDQDMAEDDDGEEGEDDEDDASAPAFLASTVAEGTFIPPQAPGLSIAPTESGGGFRVRLTLSVSAAGAQLPPGLDIEDCGVCSFCLDKPKYGGPGTKRQKCERKQQEAEYASESRNPRVWCGLHLITEHQMLQMKEISKLPLPEPLTKAIEDGPLPLVWAFKRKRRARTLPPAFVLMYYCEDRVPLDRTHLASSRQRYFKNARGDVGSSSEKGPAPRKPRTARRPPANYTNDDGARTHGASPLAVAPVQMTDPSVAHWQAVPGAACPVVYGQPVAAAPPMYAQPQYISPAAAYPQPPMYATQPVVYSAPQPQQLPMPGQQLVYSPPPPQSSDPPPAGRRGRKRALGEQLAPTGGTYYVPPANQGHYYEQSSSPVGASVVQIHPQEAHSSSMSSVPQPQASSAEQMQDETDSFFADPVGEQPQEAAARGGRGAKRSRKGSSKAAPAAAQSAPKSVAPGTPPADSNAMSNKTLELMLSRLQGQLPPATYQKVIALVRDVQTRRMSLSRSEFLQHFQAICAGAQKPQ